MRDTLNKKRKKTSWYYLCLSSKNLKNNGLEANYLRIKNFLLLLVQKEHVRVESGTKNIRLESRDTISNIIIEVGEEQTALLKSVSFSAAQSDFRSPD